MKCDVKLTQRSIRCGYLDSNSLVLQTHMRPHCCLSVVRVDDLLRSNKEENSPWMFLLNVHKRSDGAVASHPRRHMAFIPCSGEEKATGWELCVQSVIDQCGKCNGCCRATEFLRTPGWRTLSTIVASGTKQASTVPGGLADQDNLPHSAFVVCWKGQSVVFPETVITLAIIKHNVWLKCTQINILYAIKQLLSI